MAVSPALSRAGVAAVVPTLGASPLLGACLVALSRQGGGELEIVVVHQGPVEIQVPPELLSAGLRVVRLEQNRGFAAATNVGIAACSGEWVAVVNDDLVVQENWLAPLLECMQGDSRAAAAQGWNLIHRDPSRVDGGGIAWNHSWQAVQIGHGRPLPGGEDQTGAAEIFGASATAAVYRRRALEEVAGDGPFDPALVSYYEDVDLAVRLRAAGWRAWRVPAARALHAGSLTGRRLGARRVALMYGNRYLILARLLGCDFRRSLPAALARDGRDLLRALLRADGETLLGIPAGWARALRHLGRFRHSGPAAVPRGEFDRFRKGE